jgi:SET domain-containing protein
MDTRVFAHSGIEVRKGRRGRGVFAARAFAAGEAVEICPSVELPRAETTGGVLADYVFDSERTRDAVVVVLGYGMLYNHAEDPNLEYEQDDAGVVTFFAVRSIAPGEELTITYGHDWWATRGSEPVD